MAYSWMDLAWPSARVVGFSTGGIDIFVPVAASATVDEARWRGRRSRATVESNDTGLAASWLVPR
jgi:hypothetical protein